jgi:hypothetical protein
MVQSLPRDLRLRLAIPTLFLLLTACEGSIVPGDRAEPLAPATCATVGAPKTKLIRLTHAQYDNTVRDLFGLTVSPSADFQKDPTFQGFNNNADGLTVADRLGRDYRRAAEDLGLQVVTTPGARAKVVPCAGTSDDCAKQFISSFGRRAFRRPLTTDENAKYLTLFKSADAVLDGPDPFTKGLELVIEAMLQTPHFLYRVELAESAPRDNLVPLTGYEIASRLSYMLWNTTPDAALLALADGGKLATPQQVKAQAVAMLEDPRAEQIVDDFHSQWLRLDKYNNLTRDPATYPTFSAALSPMMQEETLRFVRSVIFDDKAGFPSLFTANYTYANKELAAIYGVSGPTSSTVFQKIQLDPTKRAGLLTQTGFLASHAYTKTDSPIHRGVFMIRNVLCLPQNDPPPGVDLKLPPLTGTVKTTRQQVAAHTSPATCNACHARINTMGYAFEHYDAIGQYRDLENGEMVDSTGTLKLAEKETPFNDAVGFSAAISESFEARGCYAVNWLRYAYQRQDAPDDACDLRALSENLGKPGYSIKEMIADLTQSRSFMNRPVEALP